MTVNSAVAKPRQIPWRVPSAAVAVALLLALAVAIPAKALPAVWPQTAAGTATGPQLTLTGTDESFTLQPGVPAYWQIGVTTHAVQVTALLDEVSATGSLADSGDGASATTFALAACDQPWRGAACPTASRALMPATPLGRLDGTASSLADGSVVPSSTYLLATVLMPQQTAAQPGTAADITIKVTAAGSDVAPPPQGSQPGGVAPVSPGGPLAQTGTRFGLSAVLAIAAIATGWFLAALARRRRERDAQ